MVDFQIPVVNCNICGKTTPVLTAPIYLEQLDSTIEVIICMICENVLNSEENIILSYCDKEQLEALGWRVDDSILRKYKEDLSGYSIGGS